VPKFIFFISATLLFFLFGIDVYYSISFAILITLLKELIFESNNRFVFREWALLLYSLNYLVAPAITYGLSEEQVKYAMKIPSDVYYNLALPGFLMLALGMYIIPTKIFKIDAKEIDKGALLNKKFLVQITVIALIFKFAYSFAPGELSFIFYLVSLLRFVSAFALLSIDRRLWYWPVLVLTIELVLSLLNGMYHDVLMWLIFFGLYFVYTLKPSLKVKLIGAIGVIILILFVQSLKVIYRSEVWSGDKAASLSTVYEIGSEQAKSETILGEENLLGTLNRGNQAWIFASTVDNMDHTKNFQGLTNVNKYLEAALLPRFLAPDKIKSGSQEIFNEFSGHYLNGGTSMGLGIFADGYIAYGAWGVYIFGFVLGLIFSLTFKLVERWTKVSSFYVLLLLPLLNYAVRPDCELQTTINHLAKGIILYGFLVYLTRKRFTLDSQENKRKLVHLNLASSK
jgi:hypothetical protein